jgi:hypothetical protein
MSWPSGRSLFRRSQAGPALKLAVLLAVAAVAAAGWAVLTFVGDGAAQR